MKIVRIPGRTGVIPLTAVFCLTAVALLVAGCGEAADPAPEAAVEGAAPVAETATQPTVNILEPADGAELPAGDVRVVLGAENISIMPAGDTSPNSGHHHLLLNMPVPAEGEPVPAGEAGFVHLGQAQTEYSFEGLVPGDYTLTAVIGDFAHRVIPQATDTVRFTVLPNDSP